MKYLILSVCSLLFCQLASAEFHDPMRPPPYALQKFRLAKMNKKPTKNPASRQQQKAEPWVLNSILYSERRKHAIINNKLVRRGDVIKGARLVSLGPDSVRLMAKGKVIDLSLRSQFKSIKKSLHERKL